VKVEISTKRLEDVTADALVVGLYTGETKLPERLARLDDAENALEAQESSSAAAATGIPLLDVATLQAQLEGDEAFLSYAVTPNVAAVFVVTREALRLLELSQPTHLGSRVEFFSTMLSGDTSEESQAAGLALSRELVEPVLSPIWAWLVHGETPGPLAVLGGAVILTATAYKSRADTQVVAA